MSQDYLIVIPARYKSSRFPGKPLVEIHGKSMLKRVWEKCVLASNSDQVVIATDDKRIENHCVLNNMKVIMTSDRCLTGTDRVAEVAKMLSADFYVNVQGDEPLINPLDIRKVIEAYKSTKNKTCCGMTKISSKEDFFNLNIPKVVTNKENLLLYISRSGVPSNKEGAVVHAMKQVCIYAFPKKHLSEFGLKKNKTKIEEIEDIEILRLLELGYEILMVEVSKSSVAIDTEDDLEKVLKILDD